MRSVIFGSTEQLPGGRAAGMQPAQFDPAQLYRGMRVELEHTTHPYIAAEIAMDHLAEDPHYYIKLARVHLDGTATSVGKTAAVLGLVLLGGVALFFALRRG